MRFFNAAFICAAATTAFAGGIVHNTNQSVDFVRNFAQGASTTPSGAVYWNPAGVAFAENGLYISAHSQTIWQTRTVKAQTALGFETYEGEAFVPSMPTFTAAYKHNDFSLFGSFYIAGGGGAVEFDDGVPLIDVLASSLTYATVSKKMNAAGVSESALGGLLKMNGLLSADASFSYKDLYNYDGSYFKGEEYIYAWLLGGAYKVTDILSLSFGMRVNYASFSYKARIKTSATTTAKAIDKATNGAYGLAEQFDTETTLLNADLDGVGFTPIFGLHLHFKKVDIGVKYEGETNIEMESSAKTNLIGTMMPIYMDGAKSNHDMPAMLTGAVRVNWLNWLRTTIGYNHYFDKNAEYANSKEHTLRHDEKEFVGGVEIDPLKWLTLSLGVQRTMYGFSDNSVSDLEFNPNSTSVGGGFALHLTEHVGFQVGYMETIYDLFKKTDSLTGTKRKYDRTSHNVGVGVDLKF